MKGMKPTSKVLLPGLDTISQMFFQSFDPFQMRCGKGFSLKLK